MRNRFRWLILALALTVVMAGCSSPKPAPPPPPPPPTPAPTPTPEPVVMRGPSFGYAAPVLKGKRETIEKFAAAVAADRKEEWDASRRNMGLTYEGVWLQTTPNGDFGVVYMETPDLKKAMEAVAAGSTDFDKEYAAFLKDVHGIDVTDASKMPEIHVAFEYDEGKPRQKGYSFLVPVLKGKEQAAKDWIAQVAGPDHEDFVRTRKDLGITFERVFWMDTPGGMVFVVHLESPDPYDSFKRNLASQDPYVVKFLSTVKDFTGIGFSQGPPPPNPQIVDWSAE
ncbi:MAG: DUF6176 family protein [Deltaproteobacteria bacterium]|nr:DUF6176 family protein [Deltaproteobacteria bacterium]